MAKKEFDIGAKLRRVSEDDFICEEIYIVSIDEDNSYAEILSDKNEGDIFPLITTSSKPEVGIYPGIFHFVENFMNEENLTFKEALKQLRNQYNGTKIRVNFNEVKRVENQFPKLDNSILIEEPKLYLEKDKDFSKDDINIKDLSKRVKKSIIGQDEVVDKAIATIVHNRNLANLNFSKDKIRLLKKNMLIMGKTGTGKTEIIKQIANIYDAVYVIEDATKFTMEGYVGRSVTEMLSDLYERANGDLDKAEKGILVIDEIDKKSEHGDKTVSTVGVQQSLLKVIEGGQFQIEGIKSKQGKSTIVFDTSSLTVFLLGAFSGIDKIKSNTIGFNSNQEKAEYMYNSDDLIEYGLIPELVGRLTYIAKTNDLELLDFVKIIKDSDISALNLINEFYNGLGIKITFDEDFIYSLAKKAMSKGTGARGIKAALDEVLSEFEFDILSKEVKEVDLTGEEVHKVRVMKGSI